MLPVTLCWRHYLCRVHQQVPAQLAPLCAAIGFLQDCSMGVLYHGVNAHRLLQRIVAVQSALLACQQLGPVHLALVQQLLTIVLDAYSLLQQFQERWVPWCADKGNTSAAAAAWSIWSRPCIQMATVLKCMMYCEHSRVLTAATHLMCSSLCHPHVPTPSSPLLYASMCTCRGWLVRLQYPETDLEDFQWLDASLRAAVAECQGLDLPDTPDINLQQPASFEPKQQTLASGLSYLGGMEAVAVDVPAAAIKLRRYVRQPSGCDLEQKLWREVEYAASSGLLRSPGITSNSTSKRVASGRPSFAAGTMLRAAAVAGPHLVLRNAEVRAEWRKAFGPVERVTWRDFWQKLVQPQAAELGLGSNLDKLRQGYLQQRWGRTQTGRLNIAELDLAFPPGVPGAVVLRTQLSASDTHPSISCQLAVGASSAGVLRCDMPAAQRAAQLLQLPPETYACNLYNFPEVRHARGSVCWVAASHEVLGQWRKLPPSPNGTNTVPSSIPGCWCAA